MFSFVQLQLVLIELNTYKIAIISQAVFYLFANILISFILDIEFY